MKFTLYLPATETEMLGRIKRGSAIVGQPLYPGGIKKVLVDFEATSTTLRPFAATTTGCGWRQGGRPRAIRPSLA